MYHRTLAIGDVTQGKPPSYGEYTSWYDQEKNCFKVSRNMQVLSLALCLRAGFCSEAYDLAGGYLTTGCESSPTKG